MIDNSNSLKCLDKKKNIISEDNPEFISENNLIIKNLSSTKTNEFNSLKNKFFPDKEINNVEKNSFFSEGNLMTKKKNKIKDFLFIKNGNILDNVDDKNEKEISKESMDSKQKNELKLMQKENVELQNKINDLLKEIKDAENLIQNTQNEYDNKINGINLNITNQTNINKKIINEITLLQNLLNDFFDGIMTNNNDSSNNNNNIYANKKKELQLKQDRIKNNKDKIKLLKEEISLYKKKMENYMGLDEDKKSEIFLYGKEEEKYKLNLRKLNEDIDNMKRDIQLLKIIENKHKICSEKENCRA